MRERGDEEGHAVERLRNDIASLDVTMATVELAILSLQGEIHGQEKSVVGFELQVANAAETVERIQPEAGADRDRAPSAEEELRAQEARQDEARESIARIESEQRTATTC